MSKTIEVRVPVSKAQENAIHTNMRVIDELKQAGVPVLGATVLQGVSHGTLGLWRDRDTNEHVYSWSKDATNVPLTSEQMSARNAFMPKSAAVGAKIHLRGIDPLNDDEDDEL